MQEVGRHVFTADGDLVLVHELDGANDAKGIDNSEEFGASGLLPCPREHLGVGLCG